MGSTGAGSSLGRTGGTAGAQSSTGERRVDAHSPPLGHVPSLGIFSRVAVSVSPRCCSKQTPRPSACRGTPGLPTAPGNGSAFIHPDDVPETTFLALFYFSTARNKRETNPIGAGKGTNPDQRMLWYPTTAPAASPHQPVCPRSSSSPDGVARP